MCFHTSHAQFEILKSICMSTVSIFAGYLVTTVAFEQNMLLPLIGVETKCVLMTSWRAWDHGSCCLHWSTTIADEILTELTLSFVLFSDLYLTPKTLASAMTDFSVYRHTKNKGLVPFSHFDAERTFYIFNKWKKKAKVNFLLHLCWQFLVKKEIKVSDRAVTISVTVKETSFSSCFWLWLFIKWSWVAVSTIQAQSQLCLCELLVTQRE